MYMFMGEGKSVSRSAEENELITIHKGLKAEVESQCSKVFLLSDSKVCITAIAKQKFVLHWSLRDKVSEVQSLCKRFEDVQLSHASRLTVSAAHHLAGAARVTAVETWNSKDPSFDLYNLGGSSYNQLGVGLISSIIGSSSSQDQVHSSVADDFFCSLINLGESELRNCVAFW